MIIRIPVTRILVEWNITLLLCIPFRLPQGVAILALGLVTLEAIFSRNQ